MLALVRCLRTGTSGRVFFAEKLACKLVRVRENCSVRVTRALRKDGVFFVSRAEGCGLGRFWVGDDVEAGGWGKVGMACFVSSTQLGAVCVPSRFVRREGL